MIHFYFQVTQGKLPLERGAKLEQTMVGHHLHHSSGVYTTHLEFIPHGWHPDRKPTKKEFESAVKISRVWRKIKAARNVIAMTSYISKLAKDQILMGSLVDKSAEKSLRLFTRDSWLRKTCNKLIRQKNFDRFILLAIGINTIFMMMMDFKHFDPTTGDIVATGSRRNEAVITAEPIFTAIFAVECFIKIVALGFWTGPQAYIKDSWNKLDFLVVVVSILETIPSIPKLTMFRCFRVLRPLRSIGRMPLLKMQINVLLGSVAKLGSTILLIMCVIFVVALFSLQIWGMSGGIHGRCRLTPFPVRYADKEGEGGGGDVRIGMKMEFPVDDRQLAADFWQTGKAVRCLAAQSRCDTW